MADPAIQPRGHWALLTSIRAEISTKVHRMKGSEIWKKILSLTNTFTKKLNHANA